MKYEAWHHDPVPIWGVEAREDEPFELVAEPLLKLMIANEGGVTMRGVEIGCLHQILSSGLDVVPSDSVVYCELGDKAYEYGGFPKVLMVFRYRNDVGVQVTFPACTIVAPESSPEAVAEARELYPFELERDAAGREHRCRVQPKDRADRSYLSAYGHFVPGDPWDALTAVFVYGTREHLGAARALAEAFAVPEAAAPLS